MQYPQELCPEAMIDLLLTLEMFLQYNLERPVLFAEFDFDQMLKDADRLRQLIDKSLS